MKKQVTIADPDLRGSMAAMKRAAKRAFDRAKTTGTPFLVVRDWRIVDLLSAEKRRGKPAPRVRSRRSV